MVGDLIANLASLKGVVSALLYYARQNSMNVPRLIGNHWIYTEELQDVIRDHVHSSVLC